MHKTKNQNTSSTHIPVLLDEVLQLLDPKAEDSYLDLTAGYGGHAAEILKSTGKPELAVLVDRDIHAIKELTEQFGGSGVNIRHEDFLSASEALVKEKQRFDCILADLGVSSPHLNDANGWTAGYAYGSRAKLNCRGHS